MCPQFWTSNLGDRSIFHELEQYACLCISSYNTIYLCPEQDSSVSVQNSSYSTSLATTNMVIRGSTTTCLSSSSSSTLSKLLTNKRKVSTSISPSTQPSCLGVIKQSVRDRNFRKRCRICLQIKTNINSESLMTYIPVGVID